MLNWDVCGKVKDNAGLEFGVGGRREKEDEHVEGVGADDEGRGEHEEGA